MDELKVPVAELAQTLASDTPKAPPPPAPSASGGSPYEAYLERWQTKSKGWTPHGYGYVLNKPEPGDGRRMRDHYLGRLIEDAGPRYRKARLDTFEATLPEQTNVVKEIWGFLEFLDIHCVKGAGLLLLGPCGTGKDHLAVGAAFVALGRGYIVRWTTCQDLFQRFRDSFDGDESEHDIVKEFYAPDILVLSDPIPAGGKLTDFQVNVLWRIVNARYCACKPTWATLNAITLKDAEDRLDPAVVDRLVHGALCLLCNWPSYRQPLAARVEG